MEWLIILIVALVTILLCAFFFFGRHKACYIGSVIEDETKKPLANVSVSDGRHVVKTDANGDFKLKGYRKTRFITVTPPSGYITDKFYTSANENTNEYNFTLKKSNISNGAAHSFLHISDTEVGEDGVGEWKNDILKYIDDNDPAFLIHTGDICYEAGLKSHYGGMNSETMGIPVYYAIGNHDYVKGNYGEELYESIYGPLWYSFEVGSVHYVVTPFQIGADYPSRYGMNDRWKWLKNDLKNTSADKKLIMFNHQAPYKIPMMSKNYVIRYGLKKIKLKAHNLIAWVFGHYHYNYIDSNDGIAEISTARPDCGGIDQSPAASRLISIDENGSVATKLLYLALDKSESKTPESAKWTSQLDGNVMFCTTVYQNGKIYIATADDDYPRNCGIYCLDAESGKILWRIKTENSVRNNIVLSHGKAITQDADGNVYCLDAQDGNLIWKTKVKIRPSLSTETGICVDGNTVYAGCAVKITLLDINTGKVKFQISRKKGECSPASFLIKNDKLILSSHWDGLFALDKANGKKIWMSTDEDLWPRSTTPAFISEDTMLVAESNAIMIIDVNSGKIIHKDSFEEYKFFTSSTPLIDNGIAYIATVNKGMIAYDINLHKIIWNVNVGSSMLCTPPYSSVANTVEATAVKHGDSIIFGALDGLLYIVNASNGSIIEKIETGVPILSTAAVNESSIYISDFNSRIMCIDCKKYNKSFNVSNTIS